MFRTITILIATLALAYAAWANSASTLFSKFSPERGLQLNPTSAQALINVTERASTNKDKSVFLKIARRNAITALRSEPLASRALRQLGLYYAAKGQEAEARKLVRLAASLSRRDATGQLWLADDYLRQGQYKQALGAIDTVLRTEPDTHETIFRVLGATLGDPEFSRVFVAYVRNRPSWLGPFIEYNVSTTQRPEWLSRALVQLQPLPPSILSDTSSGVLLTALVDRAPINEARSFYLKLANANPKALESLTYKRPADGLLFPPVGWQLINDGNVQGFGDVDATSTTIEAIAVPGRRGMAARKLLFLRPGSYRWTGEADLTGMSGGATAGIRVVCNDGPGRWGPLANKDFSSGRNSFDFSISPTCPAQLLVIDIVGADSQADSSMKVGNMRLAPVAGAPTKADDATAVETAPTR